MVNSLYFKKILIFIILLLMTAILALHFSDNPSKSANSTINSVTKNFPVSSISKTKVISHESPKNIKESEKINFDFYKLLTEPQPEKIFKKELLNSSSSNP